MSERTADLIDAAADAIEQCGWIQGESGSTRDGFCIYGAVSHVTSTGDDRHRALIPIAASLFAEGFLAPLRADGQKTAPTVAMWNDEDGRTEQEVLDRLRLVAKQERMSDE